jgi:hypothetical protein
MSAKQPMQLQECSAIFPGIDLADQIWNHMNRNPEGFGFWNQPSS